MHEDDYTGRLFDDDFGELAGPTDAELTEWDEDDFEDELEDEDETIINVLDAVEGAKTLQDAAERLYEYADELLSLSALGWELMNDISVGQGVALVLGEADDVDYAEGL
jgi:hypothetical protein